MYDLTNVFDIFLPQLLAYPNPKDPLNSDAAALLIVAPDIYRIKAKQFVIKFAKGDPNILNEEKFIKKKNNREENQVIKEAEEEKLNEDMSDISGVSALSQTSSISLLEDGY